MKDDDDYEEGSLDQTPPDPPQSAWWIKKYCTATSVDSFIMYFPFILLIMALVIVLIERLFIRWVCTEIGHTSRYRAESLILMIITN